MRTMNASREMSPVIVIFLNFRSLPQRFISDENLTVNVAVMILPKYLKMETPRRLSVCSFFVPFRLFLG